MNRIPTEGLKRDKSHPVEQIQISLNEQNPDRGIETAHLQLTATALSSLNEQNPDRGIETFLVKASKCKCALLE